MMTPHFRKPAGIAILALSATIAFLGIERPATADPIDCQTGVPLPLSDLIATGSEGCVVFGGAFANFSYAFTGTGGVTEVTASDVFVDFGATSTVRGLVFEGDWTVQPTQSLAIAISYDFSGRILERIGAWRTPVEPLFDDDAASLTTTVCLGDTFPCSGGTLVTLPVEGIALDRGPHHGSVEASLRFDGSLLHTDQPATVDSITTIFQIPEPSASMLILTGCAAIAMRLSFRRRGRDHLR
jgi:hypothetical protein